MKSELFDLTWRLGLEEQVRTQNSPGHHCVFHREDIFARTLIKLAHGLTHTSMSDMVAGSNNKNRGHEKTES